MGLNARQAAIRAGYSAKTAAEIGHENLIKPHVAAEIAKARMKRAERCELSADWVVDELRKIAGANMADYMKSTTDGDPYLDFSGDRPPELDKTSHRRGAHPVPSSAGRGRSVARPIPSRCRARCVGAGRLESGKADERHYLSQAVNEYHRPDPGLTPPYRPRAGLPRQAIFRAHRPAENNPAYRRPGPPKFKVDTK